MSYAILMWLKWASTLGWLAPGLLLAQTPPAPAPVSTPMSASSPTPAATPSPVVTPSPMASSTPTASLAGSAPASAQTLIDNERVYFGTKPDDRGCAGRDSYDDFLKTSVIVVCARRKGHEDYRVPSTIETDPTARAALRTGALAAPRFPVVYPCRAFCVTTPVSAAAPPIYYFDVTALPEPAEGTPAWRIAHGLAPAP